MKCPNCDSYMYESYDSKTGENHNFECPECGFTEDCFSGYARTEGYPSDLDEFEDWKNYRGI